MVGLRVLFTLVLLALLSVAVGSCLPQNTSSGAAAPPAAPPGDAFQLWQQGALRGANVFPPEDEEDDLTILRSWGANLAEIPVMDVYAPRPPYGFRPKALEVLDRAVSAAEAAGLFVALTCRTGPGRADFDRSQELWTDAEAQDAYVRMWGHLARHYKDRASIIGYDIMCEPHPRERLVGVWNELAKRATKAIREVDPQTPILVNSADWAYPEAFNQLEPTGDARTVYVVHFYQPHYYTHQEPGDNVRYPGFVDPDEPELTWDKRTIEAKLGEVRRFQQKHGVPIFAGEFGCARYAPNARQWLGDQMDLYERWGWSWAYWAFREWDVMDIEMTADPKDETRHSDTELLRLFKGYFARDAVFPSAPESGSGSGGER